MRCGVRCTVKGEGERGRHARSVDVARAEGVHSDAFWGELAGHAAAHLEDGGFRGVVGYHVVVLSKEWGFERLMHGKRREG